MRVEVRDADGDRYGVGKYARMRFADFLRKCSSDERVYLSASPSEVDAHGRPRVVLPRRRVSSGTPSPFAPKSPVTSSPPTSTSGWDTATSAPPRGSTDHHDNLYVLLRGVKRFELYAPSEISSMHRREPHQGPPPTVASTTRRAAPPPRTATTARSGRDGALRLRRRRGRTRRSGGGAR